MRTFVFIPLLLAFCSLSTGQKKSDDQLTPNTRLYKPANLTPTRAERVANFVSSVTGFNVQWNPVPNAFIIRGKAEDQEAAEAMLKRFDVPEPRVQLTIYLIRASNGPTTPGMGPWQLAQTTPVPTEIKSAIDEMKGAFKYDRYSLWDAIVVEPKGNGGELQGMLPAEPADKRYVYTIAYGAISLSADSATLNLSNFLFGLKVLQAKEDVDSHIRTDLTIHEGEKLVLGRIRLLSMANSDLFLVLTSKLY